MEDEKIESVDESIEKSDTYESVEKVKPKSGRSIRSQAQIEALAKGRETRKQKHLEKLKAKAKPTPTPEPDQPTPDQEEPDQPTPDQEEPDQEPETELIDKIEAKAEQKELQRQLTTVNQKSKIYKDIYTGFYLIDE